MTHHENAADRTIVVTRTFDAPREIVFKKWTNPQQLEQWFAPEPFTVPVAELDARPGGSYRIVMRSPEGEEFTSIGEYSEVTEPERLVYSDSLAAMPAEWVDQLNEARGEPKGSAVPDGVVTVTLEDDGGRTKLTFSEEFDSKATVDAFKEMQMVEGLNGSFDNLDKLLTLVPEDMSC